MTPITFRKFLSFVFITLVATITASRPANAYINHAPVFVQAKTQDTFIHQIKSKENRSFNYEYSLLPGEDPVKKINENVFLRVSTDKKEYYQNDLVLVTYKMYSRMVDETSVYQMPSFTGFYSFKMSQQTEEVQVEYFRNKLYRVKTLYKVLLIPFTTGKLLLSTMEVSSAVQFIQRQKQAKATTNTLDELLDQIDEEESLPKMVQKVILKSAPLTLDVHPLPPARLPGFTGAVGQFMLRDTIAQQELMAGEINKMELTLTGRGYSPATDTPTINWPPGFTVENIESKDNYEEDDLHLNGVKKITIFFSVNKEGDYTIAPSSVTYFDPAQAAYKSLQTKAYKLHVVGRADTDVSKHVVTGTPKQDGFFSKNFTISRVLFTTGIVVIILLSVLLFARSIRRSKKT